MWRLSFADTDEEDEAEREADYAFPETISFGRDQAPPIHLIPLSTQPLPPFPFHKEFLSSCPIKTVL